MRSSRHTKKGKQRGCAQHCGAAAPVPWLTPPQRRYEEAARKLIRKATAELEAARLAKEAAEAEAAAAARKNRRGRPGAKSKQGAGEGDADEGEGKGEESGGEGSSSEDEEVLDAEADGTGLDDDGNVVITQSRAQAIVRRQLFKDRTVRQVGVSVCVCGVLFRLLTDSPFTATPRFEASASAWQN